MKREVEAGDSPRKRMCLETRFLEPALVGELLVPFLGPMDVCALSCVSVTLREVLDQPSVWHKMYLLSFPSCSQKLSSYTLMETSSTNVISSLEDFQLFTMGLTDGVSVDWKFATRLRYSVLASQNRDHFVKSEMEALLEECEDVQDLIQEMKLLTDRESQFLHARRSSQDLRQMLGEVGLEAGFLAINYNNLSGRGISGICNFDLTAAIALWFPQSANPLVITYTNVGTGYNDEPKVEGRLTAGWWDLWSFQLENQDGKASFWISPFIQTILRHTETEFIENYCCNPARQFYKVQGALPKMPTYRYEGIRAPVTKKKSTGGICLPPPGNLLLEIGSPTYHEESKRNVEELLSSLDLVVLESLYSKKLGKDPLTLLTSALLLCEAVRRLNSLSWFAREAIIDASFI